MGKKKRDSDFRYETGEATVPWDAVGERMNEADIMETLRFLVRPREGKEEAYEQEFAAAKEAILRLFRVGQKATKLTLGSQVARLEKFACDYLKVKYAVFLTNATAGFEIAYNLAGLRPGDEVIVPAITFIATISYPLAIGAKVVLADVDPRTVNMDPADVARKVTEKTKVIVPVHIGGYPVEMDPIMNLADEKGIVVLEDAAHAFGGTYRGKATGTIGHFGAYSFHEVKNINAYGEGGLLVSNTKYGKDFGKCRFLGMDTSQQIPNWLYDVTAIEGMGAPFVAGNHSATEIQAVGLYSQMQRIDEIIAARRQAAERLNKKFEKVDGITGTPMGSGTTRSTHHLYLLQVDPDRIGGNVQSLKAKLKERGVTQITHFAPLYKFQIMKQLGYDTDALQNSCPVAEDMFNNRFTHLPIYGLSEEQLDFMADAVIESVEEIKAGR